MLAVPTQWLPACPIRQLTGLLCPGCGATHAILALLHGDVALAWHSNPFLLCFLPLLLAYLLAALYRHRAHLPRPVVPLAVTYSLLFAAGLFTVARNL